MYSNYSIYYNVNMASNDLTNGASYYGDSRVSNDISIDSVDPNLSNVTLPNSGYDREYPGSRHLKFLKRWGINTYNNYFNRDKKYVISVDTYTSTSISILPSLLTSYSICVPGDDYLRKYDPFYLEYRDGDNAVPVPSMDTHIDHSDKLPLEYIAEHGALEFILEYDYSYSLWCLLHTKEAAKYQMMYIEKLIREGRLTCRGKRVYSLPKL